MALRLKNILTIPMEDSLTAMPLSEDNPAWLNYLAQDDEADICHHPAWGRVFWETFGLESILIVHRTHGVIDGGAPFVIFDQPLTGKALVSMPFLNYGGLLGRSDDIRREIVEGCRQVVRGAGADYLELRHAGRGIGPQADQTREDRITYRLDINRPADDIFASFRKQLRTRLRKTAEQDLTSYQGRDRLDHFYPLFARAMKEHGTPVMPRRFFASVLNHLREQASMMIAYKDDRPLGGKLFFTFKDRVTMAWGCYPDRDKHLLANYHLTWEMIRSLAQGPIRTIDFGRSSRSSGGHDYKTNWGPQEIPIFTDYLAGDPKKIPNLKPDNAKFRLAIAVWKRLPLPVTTLIGPHLARYFI